MKQSALSSRAAQTARDLTIVGSTSLRPHRAGCMSDAPLRKLVRIATVGSFAVCAARDDKHWMTR